ncbi:MAG: N-6 DNA methylase, partial [Lachnospiraceae bacterium]|nr:N-6 DNA methylase [Lachnospiraceae bacterium]
MDVVLCADDLTQDAAEWLKSIAAFYRENDNPKLRAHVLRIFYRGMDRNYTTKDGEYSLRVMADEVKLTIREGGNSASYTYEELAERVERLIRDGHYPFSDIEKRAEEPEEEKALFAGEEAGQKETKQAGAGVENAGRENTDQENENREDPEPESADRKEIRGEDTDLKSTGEKSKEKKDGREGDNLPAENQAGMKQQRKYSPTGKIPGKETLDGGQLSLFDLGIKDGYEDASGADGDAMLDRMAMADGDLHGSATYPEERKTAQEEAENTREAEGEVDGQPMPILDIPAGQSPIQYPQAQPAANTQNYRFSESHHLYDGGPKTKCQNNIAAIRLLKELQAQSRMATPEEQITLAKFVGWGGLADALTPNKRGWETQYGEIKSLMTGEEFAAAQESTLTAYYTEQGIIRHIYDALEQFGFHGGNILDPAMATGNFFSALPESMKNSRLYGVEIEPISGNIARQLYPDADIQVTGFEHTTHPDQFFDLVVGNIPFNSIKVDDPKYNRHNFRIHDYFLAKSLDKLRPGGILAVITSKYTMDKANPTNRKYLAQRAELIGAVRLPNNAFRQVAGTEVTTDILFLQKREREIAPDESNSPWLFVEQNADGIPVNQYFIDHPEMVLGKMVFDESMYGNEKATACHPIPGDDLDERLGRAVYYLKGEYREPEQGEGQRGTDNRDTTAVPSSKPLPADPSVRNFSYTMVDGRLYYREHSRMYPQEAPGKRAERIKGLVGITQTLRGLIDFQNREQGTMPEAEYETVLKAHIANLNTVYDRFVKEYGYLNSGANVTAFSQDANAPLLRSIEKERKDEKGVYDKTAVFY